MARVRKTAEAIEQELRARPEPVTVKEKLDDLMLELKRLQAMAEQGKPVLDALVVVKARRDLIEFQARFERKLAQEEKAAKLVRDEDGRYSSTKKLAEPLKEVPPQKVVFLNGRMQTIPDDEVTQ